ncbi:hypothetical protein, partial [Helicobacter sp. UBA3407]|uniref:hypothetical protein n=1 Tax=Helicobacter sp. UBA3407 TaxID=1946588 RepID=UPI002631E927
MHSSLINAIFFSSHSLLKPCQYGFITLSKSLQWLQIAPPPRTSGKSYLRVSSIHYTTTTNLI